MKIKSKKEYFFLYLFLLPTICYVIIDSDLAYGKINSSSYLNCNQKYSHNNILDGSLNTAWVEGAEGEGIGEWVKISFRKKYIKDIGIYNGYSKNSKLFWANNRVKDIELYLSNEQKKIIRLEDKEGIQWIPLNSRAEFIKLTILSTYRGQKYNDTCITEVIFSNADIYQKVEQVLKTYYKKKNNFDELYKYATLDASYGYIFYDYLSLEDSKESIDLIFKIYFQNEKRYKELKKHNVFASESCIGVLEQKILNYPNTVVLYIGKPNSPQKELIYRAYRNLKVNYINDVRGMRVLAEKLQGE